MHIKKLYKGPFPYHFVAVDEQGRWWLVPVRLDKAAWDQRRPYNGYKYGLKEVVPQSIRRFYG